MNELYRASNSHEHSTERPCKATKQYHDPDFAGDAESRRRYRQPGKTCDQDGFTPKPVRSSTPAELAEQLRDMVGEILDVRTRVSAPVLSERGEESYNQATPEA